MEALLLELGEGGFPSWVSELADEFVEDPHCQLVLVGSDAQGAVLITIWETEMVGEVEAGLADLTGDGVRLRRLTVVDPRNPSGMF